MSFLRKLFGKAAPDNTAESRAISARNPRVQIRALHRIFFRSNSDSLQKELANISVGGMAVVHMQDPAWKAGAERGGLIVIDKDEFAIQARIRHVNQIIAGCEFAGENLQLSRAIESYLRVEILALNLRQISNNFLKEDPRGKTFWFTDGQQNEVFYVVDDQGIVDFHLSFLGNYIEGGRGKSIRSGTVHEDPVTSPGHKGSDVLAIASEPQRDVLGLATTFLINLDRMSKEHRENLIKMLGAQSG